MTRLLVRKSERTYRLNETGGFSFGNDAARQRIQRISACTQQNVSPLTKSEIIFITIPLR